VSELQLEEDVQQGRRDHWEFGADGVRLCLVSNSACSKAWNFEAPLALAAMSMLGHGES